MLAHCTRRLFVILMVSTISRSDWPICAFIFLSLLVTVSNNRSNGFGILVSVLTTGRYVDYLYQREERRVGGDYRKVGEEFRLEWTRFRSILPYVSSVAFSL